MTTATDMTEPKRRLRNLREVMPDADDFIVAFAATLADYLNDHLVPAGVNMGVVLLMHDLARGKGGFPSVRIPSTLLGQPPMVYALMSMHVPRILAAVLEPAFAVEVLEVMREVEEATRPARRPQ